jgi:uncharacterized protein YjbI with pentapeptide repeats
VGALTTDTLVMAMSGMFWTLRPELRRKEQNNVEFTQNELILLINTHPHDKKLWLVGADLSGADLRGAFLQGANLTGANLRGADLRGANLEKACLVEADLTGARLAGAFLNWADLTRAEVADAGLTTAADISYITLPDGSKHGADLRSLF